MGRQPVGVGDHVSDVGTMTLSILAGMVEILATLATSLWWALCERLVGE